MECMKRDTGNFSEGNTLSPTDSKETLISVLQELHSASNLNEFRRGFFPEVPGKSPLAQNLHSGIRKLGAEKPAKPNHRTF